MQRLAESDDFGKIVVVSPTRELVLQLASEAAALFSYDDAPDGERGDTVALPDDVAAQAVRVCIVGSRPTVAELDAAAVVLGTPYELLSVFEEKPALAKALHAVVLDELDVLLPVEVRHPSETETRTGPVLGAAPVAA